ncbi:MAG TPA: hypothetical protein VM142_11120 [Acidimicrobiales bacterium]|nr:hypothetical protein [Acidimicrobiales bacterium]
MAQHRYLIAGAKGGQGTTTIASVVAALAAGHQPTTLVATRPGDVYALTGTPIPSKLSSLTSIYPNLHLTGACQHGISATFDPSSDASGIVVGDLGRLSEIDEDDQGDADADTTRWLVVRGPCYLSLRAALEDPWRPDGIVVLAEAGRPLVAADVTDVLGVPVVAQVPVDPAVARIIDAGLLLDRLHRLSAFSRIARLVQAQLRPETASVAL